jgi:hypothetical protein
MGRIGVSDTTTLKTGRRWLLASYAAAIFTSAFLLFQVQPLVSKAILPWFGGSPAVWTTCMLFFQSLLFAGYAYAHLSQRWLTQRYQAMAHLALILAAICLLRVVPSKSWQPENVSDPVGPILLMLAATVGLPYFALSSTGPLLQAWFVRSFPGRTPYRLYSLSNVGSLLALVSYPFYFERRFDLGQQAGFWSSGFGIYAILCGITAVSLWMLQRRTTESQARDPTVREIDSVGGLVSDKIRETVTAPAAWQRAAWLLLPAFASVALLATTNHVCADVAVMPLLWIVPLALYLVTFIVAFDHSRWYRPTLAAGLTLVAIYVVALVYYSGMGAVSAYDVGVIGRELKEWRKAFGGTEQLPFTLFHIGFLGNLAWNFAAMFGVCMLCHGELVRQRPDPSHLTEFYLLIAAGGALGGVTVSLVAPHVFATYLEWDLMLYGGGLLALAILGRGAAAAYVPRKDATGASQGRRAAPALGLLLLAGGLLFYDLAGYLRLTNEGVRLRARNFFGTLMVRERDMANPAGHDFILKHGAITHGLQFAATDLRRYPTTYYTENSGVGRAIKHYRGEGKKGLAIGAVGLGTGTLAAYVGDGDTITFYEINPKIIEIAEAGRWFTYLSDCEQRGAVYDVRLGDARLSLERELNEGRATKYDMLVLDAFSGDAIPAHLLTEEAFGIYMGHVATAADEGRDGAIALHISNRYVDLEPVVRGLAERFGLKSVRVETKRNEAQAIYSSDWIVLTRDQSLINDLMPGSTPAAEHPKPAILWTDAQSNLFDALK